MPFSCRMGGNNLRSVGVGGYRAWLFSGIHAAASSTHWRQAYMSTFRATKGGGAERGGHIASEKSNRASSAGRGQGRVLQYNFLYPEERPHKTSALHKFEAVKQISGQKDVQGRTFSQGYRSVETGRLGHVDRPGRCIFSRSDQGTAQEVPTFLRGRQMLSVPGSSFWTNSSSKGMVKGSGSSHSAFERARGGDNVVFRRQPTVRQDTSPATSESAHMSDRADQVRLAGILGQIGARRDPIDRVHRGSFQTRRGVSRPTPRALSETEGDHTGHDRTPSSYGSALSQGAGHDGSNDPSGENGETQNEANPAPPASLLEAQLKGVQCSNTSESVHNRAPPLVDATGERVSGHPSHSVPASSRDGDGLILGEMGWALSGQVCARSLVPGGTETAHQRIGDESCDSSCSTLPYSTQELPSPSAFRQHERGLLHPENGRNQISTAVHGDLEPVQTGRISEHEDLQLTPERGTEHSGRLSVPSQGTRDRVVPPPGSIGASVCDPRQTTHRPVCVRSDTSASDVLLLEDKRESTTDRRFHTQLGGDILLCLSSNILDPSDHPEIGLRGSHDDPGCPMVAQEVMVHTDSGEASSRPGHPPAETGPAEAAGREVLPPRPGLVQAGSLEDFRLQQDAEGLQERAYFLRSRSIRDQTRRDYDHKWTKYADWCLARRVSPRNCSISLILEFLALLEVEGYQYNTICGYRSMISKYHEPVDGIPVGSHPQVSELVKGVFNVNPPLKKLCPAWDVHVVLDYLKGEPFVPIETCSLKFLTLKVCMVLALASARRADDISKLSKRRQKYVWTPLKIILTPDALIKQDRPGHVGKPIELAKFADEQLDIVTLLPRYLKRVENLRSDESLLVTHSRPHHKPTAQTISRWLVQVIKLAYEKANILPRGKITGHSTRAMGPSMAEYKGVAVEDILRVADWASAKTFYDFYWKDQAQFENAVLSVSESESFQS